MRGKHKNESIYVLRITYSEQIKYPAPLQSETLGYFTNLKNAEHFIASPPKDIYWFRQVYPFKIYEIEKYRANYFLKDISVRIYDSAGIFFGEHPSDYEKNFQGRDHDDCKFKTGDFVEFIYRNRLNIGMVIALPPDTQSVSNISKKAIKKYKIHPFDSSDDSYLLLIKERGKFHHEHVQVFQVFKPSAIIPKTLKRQLILRYQKCVGSQGKNS